MNDMPHTDESDRLIELERENAALRADKERLDWLAQLPDKRLSRVHDLWVNDGDIADMRAAIDVAMKEVKP
jgi:hypothetical protein